MATENPYADDNAKGEVWELGYLAGFTEPERNHFRPYSPELLSIYSEGVEAGKADRNQPIAEDGESWAGELAEHAIIHALGVGLEKIGVAAGGLISLVLTVVFIPADVQLRPLDPEWKGQATEGDAQYVTVCARSDHPMVVEGTTREGYWVGPSRGTFEEAIADFRAHGHSEALIARCSPSEGTCGPVWPVE